MIFGIGTDFFKMSGIPGTSLCPGDPFREKTFTRREQQQAVSRPVPGDYYRTRFAAKEAVFKALRSDPEHSRLIEIEILDDEDGAPGVILHGALKQFASERGVDQIHVSLTYDHGYALAFAIAETH